MKGAWGGAVRGRSSRPARLPPRRGATAPPFGAVFPKMMRGQADATPSSLCYLLPLIP